MGTVSVQMVYKRGKGLDLRAESPCIKLTWGGGGVTAGICGQQQ